MTPGPGAASASRSHWRAKDSQLYRAWVGQSAGFRVKIGLTWPGGVGCLSSLHSGSVQSMRAAIPHRLEPSWGQGSEWPRLNSLWIHSNGKKEMVGIPLQCRPLPPPWPLAAAGRHFAGLQRHQLKLKGIERSSTSTPMCGTVKW